MIHAVRSDPRVVFGTAEVMFGGQPGEHTLDQHDFELMPTVANSEGRPSQSELLIHEVFEAMDEARSMSGQTRSARAASWGISHVLAIAAVNQFRWEQGIPGTTTGAYLTTREVRDGHFIGHMVFRYEDAPPSSIPLRSLTQ